MSPSSRAIDRVKKPARYGDFGVPEYWVVDPDQHVVWVYRFDRGAEPERVESTVVWQPEPSLPALEIPIAGVFRSF